jgi:hypothetical protein
MAIVGASAERQLATKTVRKVRRFIAPVYRVRGLCPPPRHILGRIDKNWLPAVVATKQRTLVIFIILCSLSTTESHRSSQRRQVLKVICSPKRCLDDYRGFEVAVIGGRIAAALDGNSQLRIAYVPHIHPTEVNEGPLDQNGVSIYALIEGHDGRMKNAFVWSLFFTVVIAPPVAAHAPIERMLREAALNHDLAKIRTHLLKVQQGVDALDRARTSPDGSAPAPPTTLPR